MPTILAIDTSTDACSVALMTDKQTIVESSVIAAREHTQRILPMVAKLLDEQAIALKSIDAIAFGCGPGSFTGLRICISIAQGLAYGIDIPLIPVSNLAAMAQAVIAIHGDNHNSEIATNAYIIPIFDARMNEVYCAAYQLTTKAQYTGLHPLINEKVCSPEDCLQAINRLNLSMIYPAGSGWQYEALNKIDLGQNIVTQKNKPIYTNAADIAVLAWWDYQQGNTIKAIDAEPTYLRNEISWKKRTRIRQNT